MMDRFYKTLMGCQTTFMVLCAITLLVMGLCIIYGDKGTTHLLLSSSHTPFLDYTLHYWSDAITLLSVVIGVGLLGYKVWYGLFFCTNVALVTIIVQVLKHSLHAPRPILFFDNVHTHVLTLVEGVRMHTINSFPSGHTTNFFIVFFTLSIFLNLNSFSPFRSQVISIVCFLLALIGGYSRIYLSQHFLLDVFAGILITCLTTLLTTLLWTYLFHHFRHPSWWKHSLFRDPFFLSKKSFIV